MKLTIFMLGNLPNLPDLLKPSSEPGSLVPYLFWTLNEFCLKKLKDICKKGIWRKLDLKILKIDRMTDLS